FPMDPMARTFWYRLLHNKLMCQQFYSILDSTSTPICRLCSTNIETLDHLFYSCPLK
ncbi:hypothetical protein BCR42DRAFT_326964, partial [Absidia repens]